MDAVRWHPAEKMWHVWCLDHWSWKNTNSVRRLLRIWFHPPSHELDHMIEQLKSKPWTEVDTAEYRPRLFPRHTRRHVYDGRVHIMEDL
jgi:hypothetical protein